MHVPVLQKEIITYLNPKPNENFIDCTIGGGGHAFPIAERILPHGRLLGIDRDEEAIRQLAFKIQKLKIKNILLVSDNFVNIKTIVEKHNFYPVHGMLFDLGMSSWQLEESGRGFSFLREEPLDMRYGIQNQKSKIKNQNDKEKSKTSLTAKEIINTWSEKDVERILKEYGEEKFARQIAKHIVCQRKRRPIETTFQLVEIIKKATPSWYHRQNIHPATRTFQALRIAVNDELENVKKALAAAWEVLASRGRLAVISFHSLEDRIVKNFFREKAKKEEAILLTKKPIIPTKTEILQNPRARSAKLRVIEKITLHSIP